MGMNCHGMHFVLREKLESQSGQMAVEFAVTLPVLLVVALVAFNVGLLLVECASFDRVARNAVRICATTPSLGQGSDVSAARVESVIEGCMGLGDDDVTVEVLGSLAGHDTYIARMTYRPTLFGIALRSELWGVALPSAVHEVCFVVDRYKPGVIV